jgi:RimJ/RimL family protein N-acetyltransferase
MDKPILNFPFVIQVTNNICLKAVTEEDAPSFFKIILENQCHFAELEFIAPTFDSVDSVVSAIKRLEEQRKNGEGASYGLWENGNLIGLFAISNIDWGHCSADIGGWLIPDVMGRGLAFRVLISLKDYCLESGKFSSVRAVTTIGNLKAQRALLKAGFIEDRHLPLHLEVRGKQIDEIQFIAKIHAS